MGSIYKKILKDGSIRYEARTRLNGKPAGKRFRRRKDAEEWLARYSVDVLDGTYRQLKKGTFQQYIDHWKETHLIPVRYKPSTLKGYRHSLEKCLLPAFSPYAITAISSAEINRFIAKELKRGLASKSVLNEINLLGRIFQDAVSDNYLRHSPMEGVRKPKAVKKKHGRALKPEEIQSLLAVLDPKTRLLVLTAILTGMRQGEQFGLFWEDIDWDTNVIHVRQEVFWDFGQHGDRKSSQPKYIYTTPKSDYSVREIDLSAVLKKELLELYMKSGKQGLVFPSSRGTPLNANNFYKRKFKPALKAAGIKDNVRWHDLRHTFGSLKLDQGANIYYVQRQMGHSSIQVTVDIYGHLLESRKPEEAAKTDKLVFG